MAEAIARIGGEATAGCGIRSALTIAGNRIVQSGQADELAQLIETIKREHAERGA